MKNDALPSPGFIPNGHRLRQELVKSISYVEVMADLRAPAKPEQAKSLDTFLSACKTAIASFIDTTAPTFVSATIGAATPKVLTLTFSEPLVGDVVPAGTAFTTSPSRTFTKVEVLGNKVVLTANTAYAAGAVTVAYTKPAVNTLRDLSGLEVATFGAQSVTNGVV